VSSCAFTPCDEAETCAMVGGCVTKRFGKQPNRVRRGMLETNALSPKEAEGLKPTSPALNGTKPREVRDPALIKRDRKAITR